MNSFQRFCIYLIVIVGSATLLTNISSARVYSKIERHLKNVMEQNEATFSRFSKNLEATLSDQTNKGMRLLVD